MTSLIEKNVRNGKGPPQREKRLKWMDEDEDGGTVEDKIYKVVMACGSQRYKRYVGGTQYSAQGLIQDVMEREGLCWEGNGGRRMQRLCSESFLQYIKTQVRSCMEVCLRAYFVLFFSA
jgi:hypothetical protein